MERSTPGEILRNHLTLDGKRVADIGCGAGAIARQIAAAGAMVSGIDVSAKAIAAASTETPVNGESFKVAAAEDMPFEDASTDIVLFHNSVHHVAPEKLDVAIGEAARVLKPGGMLCFSEPLAEGPRWELGLSVNDESTARDRAYAAIGRAPQLGFEEIEEFFYMHERSFADFDDFHAAQITRSERRQRVFAERGAAVRATFDRLAVRRDGRCWFDQPIRINILRKRG